MAKKKSARVTYAVHPAVDYVKKIVENLPERTGKSLPQWLRLVKRSGPDTSREIQTWLKSEHGLGGTTAKLIGDVAGGEDSHLVSDEAYLKQAPLDVDAMYEGPKSHLRPIHDALVSLGTSLGSDVRVCPCKTIVPLYRNHVFAEVKPATRTRVDFGLALKNCSQRIPKRLVDTGGLKKGNRITHRFPIESIDEIDDTVRKWVEIAYELDA